MNTATVTTAAPAEVGRRLRSVTGDALTTNNEGDHFIVVPSNRWSGPLIYVIAIAVFLAILFALLSIPFVRVDAADRLSLIEAVAVLLAILALGITIGSMTAVAVGRRKCARVAASRPDAVVFVSAKNSRVRHALAGAGVEQPRLPSKFAVSVGSHGLELWGRTSGTGPRVTLSWSQIERVGAGFTPVATGRTVASARCAHIHFRVVGISDGQSIDLPLAFYTEGTMAFAGAEQANELLKAFGRWTRVGGS